MIEVGLDCVQPDKHFEQGIGWIQTCPSDNEPPCVTQSKTLTTLSVSTPGHQYTSYEPFKDRQLIDLVANRQSADNGQTWRYWLNLAEITVDYPNGGGGGATGLDNYITAPEVLKAINVLKNLTSG